MARLFIRTLKGVAFEWFMKLHAGSIKMWADLEKLFLARLFEDDIKILVPTLFATKQRKGESLQYLTGMTQSTQVETYRHNM